MVTLHESCWENDQFVIRLKNTTFKLYLIYNTAMQYKFYCRDIYKKRHNIFSSTAQPLGLVDITR